jgi:hypothetical protein
LETPKRFLDLIKKREKLAAEVHASIEVMMDSYKKLLELDHDLFPQLENPDSVFFESPLAPNVTEQWLKEFLLKMNVHRWSRPRKYKEATGHHIEKGPDGKDKIVYDFVEKSDSLALMIKCFSFVGFAIDGEPSLKTFMERAQDTTKWILRFAKDQTEVKKKGIDEIL